MEAKELSPLAWSLGGCLSGCATAACVSAAAFAATAFILLKCVQSLLRVEI